MKLAELTKKMRKCLDVQGQLGYKKCPRDKKFLFVGDPWTAGEGGLSSP